MNNCFMLLMMMFCHIIDDYCLQGILASMKQKEWWKNQKAYSRKYKNDYIVALIMHSFSWSFMIMLPIAFGNEFCVGSLFMTMFVVNCFVHGFVDDLKANKLKINLVQDQSIHVLQIILTFAILKGGEG